MWSAVSGVRAVAFAVSVGGGFSLAWATPAAAQGGPPAARGAASLEGRVVDAAGGVLPGALVSLRSGSAVREAATDVAGRFSLDALWAGEWTVQVIVPGFQPAESSVSLAEGPNEAPDVVLLPGRSEEVLVRDYASAAATRADLPLADVPQSISLVPASVLEEQQPVRLTEAVANASGIVPAYGLGGTTESFSIRGFSPDFTFGGIYRNGAPVRFSGGYEEPLNIDRIEVVKGPSSALYGQGQLAGFVNMVTKRPLAVRRNELTATLGSFEYRKVGADLAGPVDSDRKLLYRLVAAYEDSGSFRELVETRRHFVAPSVTWRPGARTDLTLYFEWGRQERDYDFGIPLIGDEPAAIPRERNLAEEWSRVEYEATRFGYELEHRLGESGRWQVRSVFRHQRASDEDLFVLPRATDDPAVFDRAANFLFQPSTTSDLFLNLLGEAETGGVRHRLLLGVDAFRVSSGFQFSPGTTSPIDVLDPVRGGPRPSHPPADPDTSRLDSTSLGVYFQDLLELGSRVKLLVGGRLSREDGDAFFRIADDSAFTPRVGLVVQPTPSLSLYGSYSTSYLSNSSFSRTFDGAAVEPQRGRQWEAGLKADLAEGRLALTLAAYRLVKTNVPIPDVANPGFVVVEGEQGGPGFEVDLNARVTPSLTVTANYAYNDATILRSNTGLDGNRLPNFPRSAGRLWVSHVVRGGTLDGLGVAAGLTARGEQLGDNANSFRLEGFVLADAAVFLERGRFRVSVNVKNVFDREYFETGSFLRTVIPGAPRTLLATLAVRP